MFKFSKRYELICDQFCYEDDLPEMTDVEYDLWWINSWIQYGVRVGYLVHDYTFDGTIASNRLM